MTKLRPHCTPFGRRISRRELDLIKRVLQKWNERWSGVDVVPLQRVSRIHRQYRIDLQVLTPLQELQQSHAIGRLIVPGAAVRGPVDQRPNRILPVESLVDLIAFKIIATRQPQKLRMHSRHHLHQVRTVSIFAILVGRREQRHQIDPHLARVSYCQQQMILC